MMAGDSLDVSLHGDDMRVLMLMAGGMTFTVRGGGE